MDDLNQRAHPVTGKATAVGCRALHGARSTAYLLARPRAPGFYRRTADREVLREIMAVVRERASYGVRRIHALVNRERRRCGQMPYNRKRIRRVMRMNKLTLPGKIRRRDRPHTGRRDAGFEFNAGVRMVSTFVAGMATWSASRSRSTVMIAR
jgi:hypothetical protein